VVTSCVTSKKQNCRSNFPTLLGGVLPNELAVTLCHYEVAPYNSLYYRDAMLNDFQKLGDINTIIGKIFVDYVENPFDSGRYLIFTVGDEEIFSTKVYDLVREEKIYETESYDPPVLGAINTNSTTIVIYEIYLNLLSDVRFPYYPRDLILSREGANLMLTTDKGVLMDFINRANQAVAEYKELCAILGFTDARVEECGYYPYIKGISDKRDQTKKIL